MTRLISFMTGFVLALLCGSFVVYQFKPQIPGFESIPVAEVWGTSSQFAGVDEQLTKFVDLFDATKSQITESVQNWDGIDVSSYLPSWNQDATLSFSDLSKIDEESVRSDIATIALKHRKTIAEIVFSDSFGWTVLLDTGEKVALGDESIAARLNRALYMVEVIPIPTEGTSSLIDARYSRGVAISEIQPLMAMQ
ncbi:MAG: cell division protein FtsQ [Gammaproteobacteria bacterium]|nr:cell division protein FtsQ [Gammaproteobacteria bacterium]